jgi:hypothetical protein
MSLSDPAMSLVPAISIRPAPAARIARAVAGRERQ